MSTAVVTFGTMPVAVFSSHCKIDFFLEVMVECRHLVALSELMPELLSMDVSDGPRVGQVASIHS